MTRPRATTSAVDELGAVLADLKARLVRVEQTSHLHNTPISTYSRGLVGYGERRTDQGSITTVVDVTGCTTTIVIEAGRFLRITGSVMVQSSVANDSVRLLITDGSNTILQSADSGNIAATTPQAIERSVLVSSTGATTTYKLRLLRQSGSGTVTMLAGATYPAFILVEDIGPNVYTYNSTSLTYDQSNVTYNGPL